MVRVKIAIVRVRVMVMAMAMVKVAIVRLLAKRRVGSSQTGTCSVRVNGGGGSVLVDVGGQCRAGPNGGAVHPVPALGFGLGLGVRR
jgi:microcompartment protein CcmL/EutN